MKQLWHMIERYYPWLLLLLGVDCFCAVILWISDIQVFQTLIGLVVLTSILLFSAILFVLNKRENTHMELFRDFLSDPTICNEERLLSAISQKEGESVRFLASVLREYKNESNNMADALRDYEEYVEGWAHEAKTPLSLLTMLLDNRNDEISPSLQAKLDYVRSQLQEDVTQMLYYARLKSSTKDYRFEDVNLNDCLGEVLEDYAPLLEEKHFVILNEVAILSQLHSPIYPTVLDCGFAGTPFSVTLELPGERLSTIVGENETLESLSFMEEYGATLATLHQLRISAEPVKDRRFFHVPSDEFLKTLGLEEYKGIFANPPKTSVRCFCHGDFHYANILWDRHHISGILDFELAGYGNRDFDIAWALFRRPGQKFLKTEVEQKAFLRGYQRTAPCDQEAVKYYMAQCYVYFLQFSGDDAEYCNYIRTWVKRLICKRY